MARSRAEIPEATVWVDVDATALVELRAELKKSDPPAHTAVVRDGKATPEELGSGTFTLNNYGVFGVDGELAVRKSPN